MPLLNWIGKESIENHHNEIPFRLLKKIKSLSIGDTSNLIIEGDNLEALKALVPCFHNQIKCIYIDPPYNTGNENWKYNDNVNSPKIRQWLGKTVGGRTEDLTRHDKWLCMMYPRLALLRELLHDEGFIFISIDDNEFHNLRSLLDEVFGEENYRATIIIRRGAKNVQAQFDLIDRLGSGYESVLMYSKTPSHRFAKVMKKLEEKRAGSWNNHWRGTNRPTMRYELFGFTPATGQWRWEKDRSEKAVKNYKNMLKELGKKEKDISDEEIDQWYVKKRVECDEKIDLLRLSRNGKPEHYIPPTDEQLSNDVWFEIVPNGSKILKRILPNVNFENPKPVELVKKIIQITTNDEDVILDSFAGSGTTGHAVLELNKDSGNRKFILVEIETNICKTVTAQRIDKVIKGYSYKGNNVNGLGGGFQYCVLSKPLFDADRKIDKDCSFEDLASYIFLVETKKVHNKNLIHDIFIGEHSGTKYYLIYNGKSKNALDSKLLRRLDREGKKVIYAERCIVSEEELEKYNVIFKQIPYEVREF